MVGAPTSDFQYVRGRPEGSVAPGDRELVVAVDREQLLTWAAHEIKSPLSAAFMATHLATRAVRNGDDRSQVERCLMTVSRQLFRIRELVTSLLDTAQLDEGRLQLAVETTSVVRLVSKCLESWREAHPDHEIVFESPGEVLARVDPERLREIVDNLVSNAIKYGGRARFVHVRVSTGPRVVRIVVTDHGAGVPPAELSRIFDPFYRAGRTGGRGNGLGLHIAAALARLHGGTISVESELGDGSKFTLTLPDDGTELEAR